MSRVADSPAERGADPLRARPDRRLVLSGLACLGLGGSAPVVRAQEFGATGDGISDDRAALQAAIDHVGEIGGGTVHLPPGRYRVVAPPRRTAVDNAADPSGAHLLIARSGVHLRGAGRAATELLFRSLGDRDPASSWQAVNGAVWRGPGVQIHGGATAQDTLRDVTISGLTLDGGAGYTGLSQWPARPGDGDGWDLTHKGVRITEDRYIDQIAIRDCVIRAFRGELIYQGGPNGGALTVSACELTDSNADAVSSSMANTVVGCHMHRLAFDGVECAYYAQPSRYIDNLIEDCDGEGVSLTSSAGAGPGLQEVRGNVLRNCRVGLLATNPRGLLVAGNQLIDCGWSEPHRSNRAIWLRDDGPQSGGAGVRLRDNVLSVDRRPLNTGLIVEAHAPGAWRDVSIQPPRFRRSVGARAGALGFEQPIDRSIGSDLLPGAPPPQPGPDRAD